MPSDLFRAFDNWLIDTIFQSICDWFRSVFDMSRRIPLALCETGLCSSFQLVSFGCILSDYKLIQAFTGLAWFFMLAFLWLSLIHLVVELTLGPPEQTPPNRFRPACYGTRWFLLLAFLGLWGAEVWFEDFSTTWGVKQLIFFLWLEAYLLACNDHPRRHKPQTVPNH